MNLVALLGGIISSVPEAIQLWNRVAPLIDQNLSIDDEDKAKIEPLVEQAHTAVEVWHAVLAGAATSEEKPVK